MLSGLSPVTGAHNLLGLEPAPSPPAAAALSPLAGVTAPLVTAPHYFRSQAEMEPCAPVTSGRGGGGVAGWWWPLLKSVCHISHLPSSSITVPGAGNQELPAAALMVMMLVILQQLGR